MTQYLPPNLLALFAPRDPIPYLPPLDKLPHEKKLTPYKGVAACLQEFEDPKDTPPPTRVETKDERKERKRKERAEQVAYKLEQDLALWDPNNDPQATADPFKSLFIGRINYDTSDSKLRREFEVYGPVKKINMVMNKISSKPRGYAFVEYEHERDMHSAYKHADGKKIDGRRVLVDVERSRTVKGWRPRRLGGGLGGTRKGGPDVNTKYSGRDDGSSSVNRDNDERSKSRERRRERSRSRERPKHRSRSPRERKRRSRSRERERGGGGRDRERERDRDKDRVDRFDEEAKLASNGDEVERTPRRKRRSRSRDRKRSRSRERKRRRSRSRDRGRRDRSRDRRGPGEEQQFTEDGMDYSNITIKQEPNGDGYDQQEYGTYGTSTAPQPEGQPYGDMEFTTKPDPGTPAQEVQYPTYPATNEYGTYQEDE